jgi:hypothetical protein
VLQIYEREEPRYLGVRQNFEVLPRPRKVAKPMSKAKLQERFFILTPTPTTKTKTMYSGSVLPVYLDANGTEMAWSGDFPIPDIGTKIFVRMNKIGYAVVKGYFKSAGFVGVMAIPTKPPRWLKDQIKRDAKDPSTPNWAKEGIGCFFGLEITLKRPKKVKDSERA